MDLVKSGIMLSTRHSRESGNPEVAGFCGPPPGLPVPWGDGFSAQILSKARNLLNVMYCNDEAGHAAYPAGFHAAQALSSGCTCGLTRTHDGVGSRSHLLRILTATTTRCADPSELRDDSRFG